MEGEVGRFRRNHLVPVPSVGSISELNRLLVEACERDLGRRIVGRPVMVAEQLATERPVLRAVPASFDATETTTARVDAKALVTVRQNRYSVPVALAGLRVSVQIGAAEIRVSHRDRQVASHERLHGKYGTRATLDHYLELLARKPGALARSLPLAQERDSGRWPNTFDELWTALRVRWGESEADKQMVDVLMLCREHGRAPARRICASRWRSAPANEDDASGSPPSPPWPTSCKRPPAARSSPVSSAATPAPTSSASTSWLPHPPRRRRRARLPGPLRAERTRVADRDHEPFIRRVDQSVPRRPDGQSRRRPLDSPRAHHRHRHRILALPPRPHPPTEHHTGPGLNGVHAAIATALAYGSLRDDSRVTDRDPSPSTTTSTSDGWSQLKPSRWSRAKLSLSSVQHAEAGTGADARHLPAGARYGASSPILSPMWKSRR